MLHVVTDSSCDLPKELLDAHDIRVVPLEVDVDGEIFREGVDITPQEYWKKLAQAKELPKTSQPSPAVWEDAFDALIATGPVICLTLSSKLSGTYQSACLARDLMHADVTIFDSLNSSLGLGLQVLRACELAEAGVTAAAMLAELTRFRDEMTTLVLLNTLDNIVKGGRLSSFSGSLSKILDIRALLAAKEGEVILLERVHGHKKLLERALVRACAKWPDMSGRDVGITHFDNLADAEALKQAMTERCHPRSFIVGPMGTSMATYAGAGGLIVSF
jgi:DegV family protein with EDD domain